tara:strand:+ start:158 stop:601 length:444 start_codon:yes stop_codon:yes gene_type:complete
MPLELHKPEEVGAWVANRIYGKDGFGEANVDYQAFGVVDDEGSIVAGLVSTEYSGHNVNIHLAIEKPRWVTRGFYEYLLHYAFCTLKVERITAMVIEGDRRVERLLKAFYFKKEGVCRKAYVKPGGEAVDAAIYGCLKEYCPLNPPF